MKRLLLAFPLLLSATFTPLTFAAENSFVSIVNPVRGADFWDVKNQKVETAVLGQIEILKKFNLSATWLLRFDALDKKEVVEELKNRPSDEKGLFLEITPTLTKEAEVAYRKSDSWHSAGSAFLTGYEKAEREKLVDTAFEKFKKTFDYYPVSVGAWWIDSYSLGYMKDKYGIVSALIVSDQYSTDNYQIWGQYFSTPYYPGKNNALHPAQTLENKLDIVTVQWAPRDPVNSYGNGVSESTFSVQANDYIDFHKLDTKYFSALIDIYTQQKFNQFSHLVVGLENSYQWSKYGGEYERQIAALVEKRNSNQLSIVLMRDFAIWYQKNFLKLSPRQVIVADDPLGSFKKVVWFMNPYYRAGWFVNSEGSVFRDIRQYIDGEEELCFRTRCDSVNFATSATRVLDDVSFGHKWVIDEGKIKDFKVVENGEKITINYLNEAGSKRTIEFLPRDISVDGKISSIDGAILDAIKQDTLEQRKASEFQKGSFNFSTVSVFLKIIKFVLFLIFACLIPGMVLLNKLFEKDTPLLKKTFLGVVTGFVFLTITFYLTSLLNLRFLIFGYLLVSLVLFFKLKILNTLKLNFPKIDKLSLYALLVILAGVVFQVIPTFKNGLIFSFGMGFWGPNTHDGVWHISLINQLVRGVPPENPIFSGETLKNYHFFYDLFIATTTYLTNIPIIDLLFRFYPVVLSLTLGIGTYYLILSLFASRIGLYRAKIASAFSLYLVYFSGSFGWIVEFIKERHFGGESAFWANQGVSFNLNPPFAASLIIVIAILHILLKFESFKNASIYLLLIIFAGSLVSFKAYAGVLIIATLLLISIIKIIKDKDFSYSLVSVGSLALAYWLFFANFEQKQSLIVFAPFWFIHAMIDSPDRVGWARLSLARMAGAEIGNWFKFTAAETVGLFIFIVGNLGFKVLGLGVILKLKEIIKDINFIFIFSLATISLLVPILFIQSGNPWNTIQFLYYFLYIAALFSGVVIAYLIYKFGKVFAFIFIPLILLVSPINSVVTASFYTNYQPHAKISPKELEALEFLSKKDQGVVLTFPYDEKLKTSIAEPWPLFAYDSTGYVSALSRKPSFIEDEGQNQILLTDYKRRVVASSDFFQRPYPEGKRFLKDNNIRYIYLPKIFKAVLEPDKLNIWQIYENSEVLVYEVK